ncbi:MAG: tetraacyldisaccharide 4'-kinase [Holophagales bacterium]|nr:tetraacyldisaccharide 4'-kinase [Holophagales bacterium]
MSKLRWLLAPLAPFYGLAVRARNRAFDAMPQRAERVSLPVLSVGNLSVGGTGKTPLTLYLAQTLNKTGYPNVIISRGYGGRREIDPMDVEPESNPYEAGDEPVMIARKLGANRIIVGRRRAAAALRAISRVPESKLLILDDGFQHRALHRDIDLLLLDGVRAWGNGKLLPLGNLREPMSSAGRAHALVVTRGSRAQKEKIEAWWSLYGSGGPVFYVDFRISALRNAATGERLSLPARHGPLFAFCALGHPQAFYADLLVAGLTWLGAKSFRDHQSLNPAQISDVASLAVNTGAVGLVCTEKDAVKFNACHLAASDIPIWIAEQEVINAENLAKWIIEFLTRA